MTPDQRAKCFCEWKDCWAAIKANPASECFEDEKAARMAITQKALGRTKSWGDPWNNKEIDRLLAVMWSIAHSYDLDLQLRQVDQPVTRALASRFAGDMCDAIDVTPAGRESYLDGICRRIHKCPLVDIDDEQWLDVLAALNHTRMHKQGVKHAHPRSPWQGGRKGQARAGQNVASHTPATGIKDRTGQVTAEEQAF